MAITNRQNSTDITKLIPKEPVRAGEKGEKLISYAYLARPRHISIPGNEKADTQDRIQQL